MKYSKVRSSIKTGDLLIWATEPNWRKPIDAIQIWAVRAFTQSAYSHIGIAVWVRNRIMVFDATGHGVLLRPISDDLPSFILHRKRVLSGNAIDWAFNRIGSKYSRWQAFKTYFGMLKAGDDNNWHCAELVNATYKADGELFDGLTPDDITNEAMVKWQSNLIKVEHDYN